MRTRDPDLRSNTKGTEMKLTLVATCMFGLEKLMGEEIDGLGLKRLDTMDGRVTFEGTEADIPRANINLRCAERIFVHLGAFPAASFAELFEKNWRNYTTDFSIMILPISRYAERRGSCVLLR